MVLPTTLLCFIHGFKVDKVIGSEDTFESFPDDLKEGLRECAPDQAVEIRVYPRYETKGDLPSAVVAFRGWLVEQVLSLEKAAGNLSPITAPTVGVILAGHSMGGLVAADTLFSFMDDTTDETTEVAPEDAEGTSDVGGRVVDGERKDAIFPAIQGILAFDTPFCGLSRSMFAYGAFAQYQQVSSAYGLVTSLSSLSLPSTSSTSSTSDLEGDSSAAFKLWTAIAMRTGAAGAVAAAGAAAYMYREQIGQGVGYLNTKDISAGLSAVNRDNIKQMFSQVSTENIQQGLAYISRENLSTGLSWVSGHLQFVGALMRGGELQDRIGRLSALHGLGFSDQYTSLGRNSYWSGGYFVAERTFCAIPPEKTEPNKFYVREVNSKAKDEVDAHTNMFTKDKNPGYAEMTDRAKGLVLSWMRTYKAKIQDPYPDRRRKQIEVAKKVEKTQSKYPTLTKYTYGGEKGLQEGKASSWLPSMPKYESLPSYPSLPTYQGVTSYIPSIPYWSSTSVGQNSEEQREKPSEGENQGKLEATDNSMDLQAASADDSPEAPPAASREGAEASEGTRDDNDLMGTLRRTGSVPGVTEDIIYQLSADVEAAREQETSSKEKEEALGASMADDVPMDPTQASAVESKHDEATPTSAQDDPGAPAEVANH